MSTRITGDRVYCYACRHRWDRAHGGLQCPQCQSDFVEIEEAGQRPAETDDPPEVAPESPLHSLRDHNPWDVPDPEEDDIHHFTFNRGRNQRDHNHGSSYTFTRTYTMGPGGTSYTTGQDPAADEVMRNFHDMINNMLGGGAGPGRSSHFGGSININGRTTTFGMGSGPREETMAGSDPFSMLFGPGFASAFGSPRPQAAGPFGLLSMLFDPANARSGDAVYSQEALDRIVSQMMDQNQQNGAPPASQDLINQLPKKKVDKSMFGDDGKAECSICMDNVELGTEVTTLPCNHWFHFDCIESWLKEHDTCPHCRKPITPDEQRPQSQRQQQNSRSQRRSSSIATPMTQTSADSPSAIRAAREQYFGRNQDSEPRPANERRSSRRSTGSQQEGGGVSGWLRSRLPFSS